MQENTQRFKGGELRVFAADDPVLLPDGLTPDPAAPAPVWALVRHVRGAGDPSKDNLLGSSPDDMPAPFIPDAE